MRLMILLCACLVAFVALVQPTESMPPSALESLLEARDVDEDVDARQRLDHRLRQMLLRRHDLDDWKLSALRQLLAAHLLSKEPKGDEEKMEKRSWLSGDSSQFWTRLNPENRASSASLLAKKDTPLSFARL